MIFILAVIWYKFAMKLIKYPIEILLAVLYYYPTGIQYTKVLFLSVVINI